MIRTLTLLPAARIEKAAELPSFSPHCKLVRFQWTRRVTLRPRATQLHSNASETEISRSAMRSVRSASQAKKLKRLAWPSKGGCAAAAPECSYPTILSQTQSLCWRDRHASKLRSRAKRPPTATGRRPSAASVSGSPLPHLAATPCLKCSRPHRACAAEKRNGRIQQKEAARARRGSMESEHAAPEAQCALRPRLARTQASGHAPLRSHFPRSLTQVRQV